MFEGHYESNIIWLITKVSGHDLCTFHSYLGEDNCVEILFEFSSVYRNAFLPKKKIFRKFSRYFYTDHPKIHFLLLFYYEISPKFTKKYSKIFRGAFAADKE